MDTFIPLLIPVPLTDGLYSIARIKQELEFCQSLLELVLEHLGQTMAPEDRSSKLGRVLSANDPVEAERLVAEVDHHLEGGRKDLALRLLHSETGLTWDDLYQVVDHWSALTAGQKRRWVRFARLAMELKAINR